MSVSISVFPRPAGLPQRQVDLVDEVPAGVAVAGEHPLGEQVVGWPPGAARRASRRRRGCPDRAARAETWAEARSSARGPTTTGPVAEVARPPRGGLVGVHHSAEDAPRAAHPGWRTGRPCRPARAARRTWSNRSLAALRRRVRRVRRSRRRGGPSPARWPGRPRPRRPRRGARSRPPAPRAGRPRRRAPRRPGRRPRRWRRRPRGRSAGRRRGRRARRPGRRRRRRATPRPRSPSRTRSTVWPSVITPVRVRGAAPKTAAAVSPGAAPSSPSRNQSTKPWMPAWRICPTQERLSAVRSPNHGMSVSIRDMAARAQGAGRATQCVGGPLPRRLVRERAAARGGGLRQGGGSHVSTLVTGPHGVTNGRRTPRSAGIPCERRVSALHTAGTSG